MDFSLTTLFVVPKAGTMATGASETLVPNTMGVYLDGGRTLATAATVVNKPFQLMQGRFPDEKVRLGSKKSGVIKKANIVEWYKVTPKDADIQTIVEVTNFKELKCDSYYSLAMRFSSVYTDMMYANGYLSSVFVQTPCCDCGADPCVSLTDAQTLTVLTELVAKANAKWNKFAIFTLTGTTTATFKITITSVPLESYNNICSVLNYRPTDSMLIFPYFIKGAESSIDPIGIVDRCAEHVTATVTKKAVFGHGTAEDIKGMEVLFHSYQSDWKTISLTDPNYNRFFTSMVDGSKYTTFVIKFKNTAIEGTWASHVPTDQTVIVAVPSENAAYATALQTVLVAELGAPVTY